MSDIYINALATFMAEALTVARASPPEEGDVEAKDELDADNKVEWNHYASLSAWELVHQATEGDVVQRWYACNETYLPGHMRVDETTRRGMTAIEVFHDHRPPEEVRVAIRNKPGVPDDEEMDEDDYDGEYFDHDELPCRLQRAVMKLIRTRPVVPGSVNGPTLTPPTEYAPEEIPKPEEFGEWA